MALTSAGAIALASLAIGDGSFNAYDNTHGYLGVGDSSTAFATSQTDLQASSNKLRKSMDATYPQRTNGVVTVRATFGSSDANFAWNEWAWFNASSAGTMMNRVVASMGTKASGASWVLTRTITFAAS